MSENYAPLRAPQRLLFGPGPSMVAPRVYAAMSQPVVGHLDPFFFQVTEQIRKSLGYVFSTRNEFNMAMSGTGSSGMEAAVANFAEPDEPFAVFTNGFFGDRIGEMARRHGAHVLRMEKEWGQPFDPQQARDFIRHHHPRVVAFVQAETSTGVYNDAHAICEAAHEVGALVITDCVTSLGTMPVMVDRHGIDVAFSCTQKGLSCPPGLAPITVSPRALEQRRLREKPVQSWYLDLLLLDNYFEGHRYHHTASATLFYALREGLALIHEEGLEARWERHRRNHLAMVAGLEAMGLEMFVGDGHRLWTITTPCVPAGIDEVKVRQYLLQERGIEIAGGFGPLAGKIFRIGTMGYGSTAENVVLTLEALGAALQQQGYRAPADGIAAAEKALGVPAPALN